MGTRAECVEADRRAPGPNAAAQKCRPAWCGRVVSYAGSRTLRSPMGSLRIIGEQFLQVLDALGCERHNRNVIVEVQDAQRIIPGNYQRALGGEN